MGWGPFGMDWEPFEMNGGPPGMIGVNWNALGAIELDSGWRGVAWRG